MKSNTLRLEEPLLKELYPLLGRGESLASFVRTVLKREIMRHKMRKAATRYVELLESSPAERELLEEWESTDLLKEPKIKGQRSTTKSRKKSSKSGRQQD